MRFLWLFSLICMLMPLVATSDSREFETTREEILASRRRRSKQLEALLDESKARLADHKSRRKILSDNERSSLEKKISIYTRKLETMQTDLEEREIERIIRKEQLRNERMRERRAKEEL